MSILITGGAGYIGSHCVSALSRRGGDAVVVDNLSKGHKEALSGGRLYVGDVGDRAFLRSVFEKEQIDAVIHFAAFSLVGESMTVPEKYFRNNCMAGLSLLETMAEFGVRRLVFSSTAAVYGEPERVPIGEEHPKSPTNPYGQSKLIVEEMLRWFDAAHGLKYAALRYFNVAGAREDGGIGEDHRPETHLIPLVLAAAQGKRESLTLFGTDYPTPDGTCVRDYIHVEDLVDAHFLALQYLEAGNPSAAFNLGNGRGFSNREIIEAARRVTGKPIPVSEAPRRPGDPAVLVASSEKAEKVLGWKPKHPDIEEIIADAWRWHEAHPEGYGG
ncbi:UDP-glucose 4-epimerase GalE [Papillibacter cinnamivorans]|uniref:UDP-glucose 4-epimerase n=1 Tax=Papillibacter cinnamivorans DSM 12816 TaxID=1122930 RepID=A0A1W2AWS9_9FIRM|nr:UDP-glucose 4-epimerase GalE [Papillibacter cinnamivorans]SMC64990.1 UDP-glucose 4-epimerase [Papillibacter cinnamivorans DSM 12816]